MNSIIEKQKQFFNTNKTKSTNFRKAMLKKLYHAVLSNEPLLYKALKLDLNKSESEAYVTEIQIILSEIKHAWQNLDRFNKPQKKKTPITHLPASSYVYREPYGSVLIMSPWNYPVQLALVPLAGAIAGGNCAVIKPSKSSKHVSAVIRKLLNETFKEDYIYCVNEAFSYEEILRETYDLIFFTGSERVGQIVMAAASKHITPVILELGGKSPCIIDKSANLKLAAKRIAWGKFLNAGQTCVAPDYVLIDSTIKKQFLKELKQQMHAMYGNALHNENYPKIINKAHFERLTTLIANEEHLIGGRSNPSNCCIEPTIFTDAAWADAVMQEEIFGPVLPVISYESLGEVIRILKGKPKPLACYFFSRDKLRIKRLVHSLSFGGGCINDVVMHLGNPHLPFGGAGSSGMGQYHGAYSFAAFTRPKSIHVGKNYMDIPLRYPPYSAIKSKVIKLITKL